MKPTTPAPAGYSGTPLPKKLGIQAGFRVGLVNAPENFRDTLGPLPEGVLLKDAARADEGASFDVIVCFVQTAHDVDDHLRFLRPKLTAAGGLWLGWRKKLAKGAKQPVLASDVSESVVRSAGLAGGLVDNKVCAIDEVWSGLRFVVRVEQRPKIANVAKAAQPATRTRVEKRRP